MANRARGLQASVLHGAVVVLAAGALLACSLGMLRIQRHVFVYSGTDMTAPLIGARAALEHRNPYSDAVTAEIQRTYYGRVLQPGENWDRQAFAYPLHSVFLFAPLTRLSWHGVRILTLCLFPLLLAACAWLWARVLLVPPRAWMIAAAALSWPAIAGYSAEQITIPVFAMLTLACYLLTRRCDLSAAVLLALATGKPQLVALLLPWLLVWAIANRKYRFVAGFLVAFAALMGAAHWLVPGWTAGWQQAAAAYGGGLHKPLFIQFFGFWAGVACMAALAGWVLWALYRIGLRTPHALPRAIPLLLAVTLVVTPANPWLVYNYVLLYPALLALFYARDARDRIARRAVLFGSSWLWLTAPAAVLSYALLGYRFFEVLLPLWSVALPVALIAVLYRERQPA